MFSDGMMPSSASFFSVSCVPFSCSTRILAAAYHLENLGDKFNFANAARAEFDVVRHAFFTDFAADLAVQVAHRFIRAVIQIFAEHKRAHQRFDVVRIRRDHAAFAPRIAFPFAPLRNQVLLQRGSLNTSAPESPSGRSRISTRNTCPSAVMSFSSAISFCPTLVKNS